MLTTMDAAVVARPGTPGGGTGIDAGAGLGGFTGGGLGNFDASGLFGAAREAGVIGTAADGGLSFNPSAACSLAIAAQYCVDGSLMLPPGLIGGGGAGGGIIAGLGGLTAGLTGGTGASAGGTGASMGGAGASTGGGSTAGTQP